MALGQSTFAQGARARDAWSRCKSPPRTIPTADDDWGQQVLQTSMAYSSRWTTGNFPHDNCLVRLTRPLVDVVPNPRTLSSKCRA